MSLRRSFFFFASRLIDFCVFSFRYKKNGNVCGSVFIIIIATACYVVDNINNLIHIFYLFKICMQYRVYCTPGFLTDVGLSSVCMRIVIIGR